MELAAFQQLMDTTYGHHDRARGVPSTVAWLAEEVGELAQAVRKGDRAQQEHEFADVLAWLASLANQMGIDLTIAADRYAAGCPRCRTSPCACVHADEWTISPNSASGTILFPLAGTKSPTNRSSRSGVPDR